MKFEINIWPQHQRVRSVLMTQVASLPESMLIAETASLVAAAAADAVLGAPAGVKLSAPPIMRVARRAAMRLRMVADRLVGVVLAGMAGSFRSIGAA
jgi:hypothetical protein